MKQVREEIGSGCVADSPARFIRGIGECGNRGLVFPIWTDSGQFSVENLDTPSF